MAAACAERGEKSLRDCVHTDRHATEKPAQLPRDQLGCAACAAERPSRAAPAASHQGTTPASSKRAPVPGFGINAIFTAICAPCCALRGPECPLRSVAQYPGQTALTLIPCSASAVA